jgi:hypothetical protein
MAIQLLILLSSAGCQAKRSSSISIISIYFTYSHETSPSLLPSNGTAQSGSNPDTGLVIGRTGELDA